MEIIAFVVRLMFVSAILFIAYTGYFSQDLLQRSFKLAYKHRTRYLFVCQLRIIFYIPFGLFLLSGIISWLASLDVILLNDDIAWRIFFYLCLLSGLISLILFLILKFKVLKSIINDEEKVRNRLLSASYCHNPNDLKESWYNPDDPEEHRQRILGIRGTRNSL